MDFHSSFDFVLLIQFFFFAYYFFFFLSPVGSLENDIFHL